MFLNFFNILNILLRLHGGFPRSRETTRVRVWSHPLYNIHIVFIITPRSEGTYFGVQVERFIMYLLCIKQLLSNFEPQNGEKNKQLLGLGPSQVAYKKKVYPKNFD